VLRLIRPDVLAINQYFPGVVWRIGEVGEEYVQATVVSGELPPWVGTAEWITLFKPHLSVIDVLDAVAVAGD
jgi:hypothetical protein